MSLLNVFKNDVQHGSNHSNYLKQISTCIVLLIVPKAVHCGKIWKLETYNAVKAKSRFSPTYINQDLLSCSLASGSLAAAAIRLMVVAKGDAREVGDRELELFQICQSTSLPGLSVNFFR